MAYGVPPLSAPAFSSGFCSDCGLGWTCAFHQTRLLLSWRCSLWPQLFSTNALYSSFPPHPGSCMPFSSHSSRDLWLQFPHDTENSHELELGLRPAYLRSQELASSRCSHVKYGNDPAEPAKPSSHFTVPTENAAVLLPAHQRELSTGCPSEKLKPSRPCRAVWAVGA